jgi:hypothetical protein
MLSMVVTGIARGSCYELPENQANVYRQRAHLVSERTGASPSLVLDSRSNAGPPQMVS